MRLRFVGLVAVIVLVVAALIAPAEFAQAGGGWRRAEGGPYQNEQGEWLIQAEHVGDNGLVDATVTTGTTNSRRKARRASNELADSLNEAGGSFKWDPACDSLLFDC
jgi:hypothetical protein